MTEEINNPIDRPDCPADFASFVSEMAKKIGRGLEGKEFGFFGDTKHKTQNIFMFMFSRVILQALSDAGMRHLMVEFGKRDHQVFFDAVADGRLTASQYHLATSPVMSNAYGPEFSRQQALIIAEGVKTAASLGIHIHCVDGQEGLISPQNKTKYFGELTKRHTGWLKYVLNNPSYFNQPQELLDVMSSPKFLRSLPRKTSNEIEGILWKSEFPPDIRIFSAWYLQNEGKTFGNVSSLINAARMQAINQGTSSAERDRLMATRFRFDGDLMDYINIRRKGEKTGVLYGAGHMRNEHWGLTKNMSPDQCGVFTLVDETDVLGFTRAGSRSVTYGQRGDKFIFIPKRQLIEFEDLPLIDRPLEQSRPAKQKDVNGPGG